MGIADETDRTLFVGNLDPKVTEELLFELFLQAGPLIKVKIPKENDGRQKSFGFAVFKHEESAPYGMNLLNGISLFGRTLKVQFRAGSTHINSPENSQNARPVNTHNPYGARYNKSPDQMGSPLFSPPQNQHRSFSSPDSLQRNVMMNNMWQIQMQQLQQLNGSLPGLLPQHSPLIQQSPLPLPPPQQHGSRGGNGGILRQQDEPPPRGHRQSYQQNSASYSSRDQHYPCLEDSGAGSNRHHRTQRNDHYQHDDRGGNRSRNHQDRRKDESRDGRWRRY